MPYTTGTKTFTAYEDIPEHRIVVLRHATADPFEVGLADENSENLFGVTMTSAKAGDLISVRPFDNDGTFEIESAGTIGYGNRVYVYDGSGRVNDEVRTPIVGRALSAATVGQLVTVALTKDMVTTLPAEDITIEDAGGHYTSDDVEGALQEAGSSIDTIESDITTIDSTLTTIQANKSITEWISLSNADRAVSGGFIANAGSREMRMLGQLGTLGDFELIYLANAGSPYYGDGHLGIKHASGTLNSYEDRCMINFRPQYKVLTSQPISFRIYVSQAATTGSTHVSVRFTAKGGNNERGVTDYDTIYMSTTPQGPTWYDLDGFDVDELGFTPSEFIAYISVVSDGTNGGDAFLYGIEMSYSNNITDL